MRASSAGRPSRVTPSTRNAPVDMSAQASAAAPPASASTAR